MFIITPQHPCFHPTFLIIVWSGAHQNVHLNKELAPSKWRFFHQPFAAEGECSLPTYSLRCAGFTQQGSAVVDIGSLSDELFVNTHTKASHSNGDLCRPRKTMVLPRCERGRGGVRPSEHNGLQSVQSPLASQPNWDEAFMHRLAVC